MNNMLIISFLMPFLKFLGALIVVAICVFIALNGYFMMNNLDISINNMLEAEKASYPESEIPPALKRNQGETASDVRTVICKYVGPDSSGKASSVMDIEEEKKYPYYHRTHNVISDLQRYTEYQVENHSWYGCDEWLQDMTANRIEEEVFQISGKKGE